MSTPCRVFVAIQNLFTLEYPRRKRAPCIRIPLWCTPRASVVIVSRLGALSTRYQNLTAGKVSGQDVETSDDAGGYYRLAFGGEETACIGYHATEDAVKASREEGSGPGEGTGEGFHVRMRFLQPWRAFGAGPTGHSLRPSVVLAPHPWHAAAQPFFE